MEGIVHTFGIDWKLLLAQAVNFFILLVVLRAVAYKPLLELLRKRQKTIEAGLDKAREADERLSSVQHIELTMTKNAEEKGRGIIHDAEAKAQKTMEAILEEAHTKEELVLREAHRRAEAEKSALMEEAAKEAAGMVKEILVRTVQVAPEAVDDALIKKVMATPPRR
jgi:F-type H+-transporting ATPase subunit b